MQGRIHALTLPKWGLTMTEGTIVAWRVEEGAELVPGTIVAEIESEKIVNDLVAHEGGILRRRLVGEGDARDCRALIGIVADGEVSEAEIDAYIAAFVADADSIEGDESQHTTVSLPGGAVAPPGAHPPAGASIPASLTLVGGSAAAPATDYAAALARRWSVDLSRIRGSGGRGRVTKSDLIAAILARGGTVDLVAVRAAAMLVPARDPQRPATPVARRLAAKLGVALASIPLRPGASRIRKADVLEASDAVARSAEAGQPAAGAAPGEYEERVLSSMRRVIGQRLAQSKQLAPHFRLVVDLRVDALLELRRSLAAATDARVSLNDLLIKAAAQALVAVPEVNVQVLPDRVRYFRDAHISVAVAIDGGLITPIVRAANRKGVPEIAAEMQALTTRARANRLAAEDIEGGTFSISNLGMFGIRQFDAIINPPQGAILAVGAAQWQYVFSDDGAARTAMVLTATLVCDHRAIDGVLGARFLQALRGLVETPGTMLL